MSVADTRTPVTVVTGASNGIGRAIAEAVLAQGRAVVNLDYVLPTWSHPLLTSYQGDLTDEASTRERAAEIAACEANLKQVGEHLRKLHKAAGGLELP